MKNVNLAGSGGGDREIALEFEHRRIAELGDNDGAHGG
jgi:hypothetical protein